MKKVAPEPSWENASARWLNELGMTRSTYRFSPADHDAKANRAFPHVGQPERTPDPAGLDRSRALDLGYLRAPDRRVRA